MRITHSSQKQRTSVQRFEISMDFAVFVEMADAANNRPEDLLRVSEANALLKQHHHPEANREWSIMNAHE